MGAAPKGSGNGPSVDLLLGWWGFENVLIFPKSAKLEFAFEEAIPSNRVSICFCCNARVSSSDFKLLVRFGGHACDVDWTGLLPVVGHGLVFSCAKLLVPGLI